MIFVGGVRSPVLRCTSGDSVNENFGPFYIGPGLWDRGTGEVWEDGRDDGTDVQCHCLERLGS